MDLETKAGQQELERKIKMLLLELGVNAVGKGFKYAADAICITVGDLEAVEERSLMELYAVVAALYGENVKPLCVERCIRHSIERAFDLRTKKLESIFKGIEDANSGKVTNGCFIHTLAQYLLVQG